METKGVVVWQRGTGDGTSEGSRPAEAWAIPAVIDKAPSIYNTPNALVFVSTQY